MVQTDIADFKLFSEVLAALPAGTGRVCSSSGRELLPSHFLLSLSPSPY